MKLLLLLLLVCSAAYARVGEKYSDFTKRIAQEEGAKKMGLGDIALATHQVNGMTVNLTINNGEIVSESYSPIEQKMIENFFADQKLSLEKKAETATQINFAESKGGLLAVYKKEKKQLSIFTLTEFLKKK